MRQLFTNTVKAFRREDRGNVAMMTAIAGVVILGGAALALDITRGVNSQVNLADASDTVALMLAKSGLETEAEMRAAAESHLAQLYPGAEGSRLEILSITRDGDAVRVRLADNIDTTFAAVLGRGDLDVSAAATAVYAEKEMDIALVLDTTESMKGAKMDALKVAAGEMVQTLQEQENDKLRMSVVPFSNHVNVGLSQRGQRWLDVPADKDTRGQSCGWRQKSERYGCESYTYTCYKDGVASTCRGTKNCKTRKVGKPVYKCNNTGGVSKWNGCVGSRDVPRDTRPAYAGAKIPGLRGKPCGNELTAMTSDLTTVSGAIKSLKPKGDTYLPAGLMWGWRTLESSEPFASAPRPKSEKVVVLMTDGTNSVRKKGAWHTDKGGNSAVGRANAKADADRKTRDICDAMKADDMTIYTIAYDVPDASTKTLLERCASSPAYYFDASGAAELTNAFREIGESLQELRISA